MISYPLREYISSKKNDDYHQSFSSSNYSSTKTKNYSENTYTNRFIYFVIFVILLLIICFIYSYYSFIDPTCFNRECSDFVCKAYSEGLIGGQLCPDLCTTKSILLENCLGEHKQFRSRILKLNHLISSRSILSRLPNRCHDNRDCLYDSYCNAWCNTSINSCQMKEFNENSLNELCSLISSLVRSDANITFIENFNPLIEQCQQIINDEIIIDNNQIDLISLQIRQNLILQNLKNLLWTNIEYQMNKITKKTTKKLSSLSTHAVK
ncbi:unnamed protein product [Rotaria magnacalcarata]|uniref:FAM69 N-terminal domain-containing protein n=1 Tax=Rotaria magnacalcarata TaxID=392030 RepID=A0A8S2JWJ6_9BILA|nr:unnamed protein product [Rotaria magnacalcarata]